MGMAARTSLCFTLVLSWVGATRAEDETVNGAKSPNDEPSLGYWGDARARPFVAGDLAVGAVNSASVAAGYGKPHFIWVGAQGSALMTGDFAMTSGALVLSGLLFNVHVGIQRTVAFRHRFVERLETYHLEDINDPAAPRSRYTSLDVALYGLVPAGPILGYWGARGSWLFDVPDGRGVFSEYVRFTLHERRVFLFTTAWWWRFLGDALLVGPAADLALTAGRDPIVRVGGAVLASFGPHLSLEIVATLPVSSPDPGLSPLFQSWGTAGLRWRWASDEMALSLL